MQAWISGAGVWGPGFCNLDDYRQVLQSGVCDIAAASVPKPELIPARERRRSPTMVKLAIEVAGQACSMAGVEPSAAHCVFSSGIGDAELTDYMCRVLAGPDKLLSPTKFHNSVHNAAVGYWSISTGCEQPATFVSSLESSFSSSLMEAMVQVVSAHKPVLLVLSDIPIPAPMHGMHPIDQLFAAAFMLEPVAPATEAHCARVSLRLDPQPGQWPAVAARGLEALYEASPSAKALCLLDALCSKTPTPLALPLTDSLAAHIELETAA